jgi:acyl-CoA thioesterase-1
MSLKQMAPFFLFYPVRAADGGDAPAVRLPEVVVRASQPPRQLARCAVLVALLVVATACGQADIERAAPAREATATPAAAAEPAVSLPRIVFLGDSLTAGLGLAQHESVPALIQSRLNAAGYRYEVVNAGVSGDTSAGGLSRLDWSLEGMVAVLVVELGGNDGLRGLPVSQMKQNLSEIITRAQQRAITVVLTGMEAPPNYGPLYTSEFRQVFRDLAQEHDVIFVPFYLEGVAGDLSLNLPDGIHPNAAGSRVIEERLWRTLEPLLERRDELRRRSTR